MKIKQMHRYGEQISNYWSGKGLRKDKRRKWVKCRVTDENQTFSAEHAVVCTEIKIKCKHETMLCYQCYLNLKIHRHNIIKDISTIKWQKSGPILPPIYYLPCPYTDIGNELSFLIINFIDH